MSGRTGGRPGRIVETGRRIGRRDFLRTMGGLGLGLVAARCAPAVTPIPTQAPTEAQTELPTEVPSPAIGGNINLILWQGYDDPEAFQPFYDEYGVVPNATYIGSNDEVLTKYIAGGPGMYDITCINALYVPTMAEEEMIIPLDESKLPNLADVAAEFMDIDFVRIDGQIYSVPAFFGFDGIVYDADLVDEPENWEFWKEAEFSGKWGLLDNPAGSMMIWGGMGLGLSARLSEWTKDDLANVVEHGREVVASAATMVKSFGEMTDLLVRGDIVAAYIGDPSVAARGREQGANLEWTLPPGRAHAWLDCYMILNGSRNLQTAYAWVDHAISPEAMAIMGQNIFAAVSNTKAVDLMPPEHVQAMAYETLGESLKSAVYPTLPDKEPEPGYIGLDEFYAAWEEILAP